MRWKGRERSQNVEDRRKMGGPAMVGGGGLITVIIVVVLTLMRGGNVEQAVQQGARQLAQQAAAQQGAPAQAQDVDPNDPQAEFVSVVLKDTEDVWNSLFPRVIGKTYQETTLVLFRGATSSGCGHANSAVGPFYCPADSKVYLDLSFFDELRDRFGAPGDFACAYVVAHEVGHHVQNLLGLSDQVHSLQQQVDKAEGNRLSVRLELQADFLAGVWAHHADKTKGILESGDIGEAIRAAQAIGDDTLQRQAQGTVRPDSFTHGTSEQRIRWFSYGLKSGNLDDLGLFFERNYNEL